MYKSLIIGLLLLVMLKLNGQTDFKPGYIITLQGDTIYGYVDYRSNNTLGKSCGFKKAPETEKQQFLPDDIFGYRIENQKMYVSKNIPLNGDSIKVFVEFLVDGIVDLFYYVDVNKYYFFIEKEGKLYPLTNEEKEIIKEDVHYLHASNQFKGALAFLYSDAPEIQQKITSLPFDYRSLIHITKEYHNVVCTDKACIDYTKSTKIKMKLEPVTGLIKANMGLETSDQFGQQWQWNAGINMVIVPFKIKDTWNFKAGLQFSPNHFKQEYENYLYEGLKKYYLIDVSYTALRIPITVNYSLPFENWKPFFTAGFTPIWLVNQDWNCIYISKFQVNGETITVENGAIDSDFKKFQFGFTMGAGLTYEISDSKALNLQVGYEYRIPYANFNHILDYQFLHSMMFQVGFNFALN